MSIAPDQTTAGKRAVQDATAEQVLAAIRKALQARDFPAVVDLLHLLAAKDPESAEVIVGVIQAMSESNG